MCNTIHYNLIYQPHSRRRFTFRNPDRIHPLYLMYLLNKHSVSLLLEFLISARARNTFLRL